MEYQDDLYAKWLNGEISDEEFSSLEGPDALAKVKRVVETVDQWSMPKYDTTQGYKKFKENNPEKSTSKIRKINWLSIGSIAACFLIFAVFWTNTQTNKNEIIFAENGQNENIRLTDGSEIRLNDGSTIEYNKKNWANQRTIELKGEAQFEVSKGSPFIVNTSNGSIQVLGTQFNVRAWGGNLYVECYEGKVSVKANNQEMILTANEAVNVVEGSMLGKQTINHASPLWTKSTSRFYSEKFTIVLDELERQFNIQIKMDSSERVFSGNFSHDNLENALKSICKPLGLDFSISEDRKTVVIE